MKQSDYLNVKNKIKNYCLSKDLTRLSNFSLSKGVIGGCYSLNVTIGSDRNSCSYLYRTIEDRDTDFELINSKK